MSVLVTNSFTVLLTQFTRVWKYYQYSKCCSVVGCRYFGVYHTVLRKGLRTLWT